MTSAYIASAMEIPLFTDCQHSAIIKIWGIQNCKKYNLSINPTTNGSDCIKHQFNWISLICDCSQVGRVSPLDLAIFLCMMPPRESVREC